MTVDAGVTLSTGRFVLDCLPSRVRFGAGALAEIPDEIDRLNARRVLLIDGLPRRPFAARARETLGDRHVQTLQVARQHVPAELAQAANELAASSEADCLLAVGGGSAIGVAKAIARGTRLPIVAVPTTYAGSEMTPIWGITSDGVKRTGVDPGVLPRCVVYDPELTLSFAPAAAAASGMNAVAHCVEALWSAARNPLTDAIASEGITLLAGGLRGVVADPQDRAARSLTLRGAWLAGLALAQGGTALHHTVCHVLGGRFGLPHAEVHAAVLPWVVEHFRDAAPAPLARVAGALGSADAAGGLFDLAADLGLCRGLRELGLTDAAVPEAAEAVAARQPTVPAPVTTAELCGILGRAMSPPFRGSSPATTAAA